MQEQTSESGLNEFSRAPHVDCIDEGFVPHKESTWKWRYGELKEDLQVSYYEGYWKDGEPVMRNSVLRKGTTVKIVMASRFGDVGITEDLSLERGYGARVFLDALDNLRLENV